jgi:hypothetical protein
MVTVLGLDAVRCQPPRVCAVLCTALVVAVRYRVRCKVLLGVDSASFPRNSGRTPQFLKLMSTWGPKKLRNFVWHCVVVARHTLEANGENRPRRRWFVRRVQVMSPRDMD